MSDVKFCCAHCNAELSSGRCDVCGTWVDTNFLGKAKKSVGIHPALAKRYASSRASEPPAGKKSRDSILSDELKPPSIPGYELLDPIGKGAMGSVYQAKHIASGRTAAVKILSAEMSSRSDLVARFERESAALSSFRHPNVVAIFDSGTVFNTHFFCMEFIDGITLRRFLKDGPLPLKQAIHFVRQILAGLSAAHSRSIIHRDLKPENVLVAADLNRCVLVDFGLAGLLNEATNPHPNLTRSRVTMGTVNYMAPEQHMDAKRVDGRSDLYSVGVIFYECVLGDLPLGRFALPSERHYEAPEALDRILSKALCREPEKRFQNAAEFDLELQALERETETWTAKGLHKTRFYFDSALSHQTEHPTQWAAVPPWVRKPRFLWGATAMAVGIILGILISRTHPKEIVLSPSGAYAIDSASELQYHGSVWKSESPVWEEVKDTLVYQAKQGNSGHFRRDLSLLIQQDAMDQLSWSSHLSLERLKLSLSVAKTQHLAREKLGSNPEPPAGGLFFVSPNAERVLGMVTLSDNSCWLCEFRKQDGFLKSTQQAQIPCKGKHPLYEIRLDAHKGLIQAWIDKKPAGSLEVKNVASEKWQRALGCRNVICDFKPVF
ncbi:MAG: serine/threonine protein kinase [Myxococcaceae bacterium]|nr:serine/threonine protein kinase [Myxococcaceae bacterium]MBH2005744.1 serine/threonine protein kinase [Myxococcaceae bacterium]